MNPAHRPAARSSLALVGAVVALLVAGSTLSACGQKGQLYLPSQKKSKVPPSPQPDTQPQDSQPPGTPPPSTTSPSAS
jgi:predicted small lipoprotein YifL